MTGVRLEQKCNKGQSWSILDYKGANLAFFSSNNLLWTWSFFLEHKTTLILIYYYFKGNSDMDFVDAQSFSYI